MESIKTIYKIGRGPSSSHTMGPQKAAQMFREQYPEASAFAVTLYGSLAATGKGHMTDVAVMDVLTGGDPQLSNRVEIIWKPEVFLPQHPNGMLFQAFDAQKQLLGEQTIFSIGGGDISLSGKREEAEHLYEHSTMADIMAYCKAHGYSFWEYVYDREGSDLEDYLAEVWRVMQEAVLRGLDNEGVLPGGLKVIRRASAYYQHSRSYQGSMQRRGFKFAYALAVAEENASGGVIVTAPTCGSCGVMPGTLYHLKKSYDFSDKKIFKALATAGLVGTLIKTNASISGAEVGCQGEIGTACSMASSAATQLFGGSIAQIEYAAATAMEHCLGLTCDPICGLVQVPCIERNAFAVARSVDATQYALMSDGTHIVPFDTVIEAMKQTGHDLPSLYKETAAGGLAVLLGKK
ncbi:MAG: L-serine ammonia-lyase [Bacteroidales bacterium]|nr:L-serine ammonia-lyase [Bacteroidales bacterium]